MVPELPLPSGRRADLTALGRNGLLWIVEVKSSVEDFRADRKWEDYRLHADRVLFAVAPDFPVELLPEDAGLILADGHGAELQREGVAGALAAPTRKVMTLRFARAARRADDAALRSAGARPDGSLEGTQGGTGRRRLRAIRLETPCPRHARPCAGHPRILRGRWSSRGCPG